MENVNEIITSNDEVIESAEDVIEKGGMKLGFKIAIGAGITAVVGYAAYRFVVKPAIARIAANKAAASLDETGNDPAEQEIEISVEEKSA